MNRKKVDCRAEIKERLEAEGIYDEYFIDTFLEEPDAAAEIRIFAGEDPGQPKEALDWLVDAAKLRYVYWGGGHTERDEITPKRSSRRKKKTQISDAQERQESLAKYLTARMRPSGGALTGGRLLSPEEATALLESPLAASFSAGFMAHYGFDAMLNPVLVEEGEDERGSYRTLRTGGELETRVLKIRPLGRAFNEPVYPGARFKDLDFAGIQLTAKAKPIFVVHPHNHRERIVVRANSVLARLDKAAGNLHKFPISSEKALWFILTGEFIPEAPAKIRTERINIPGFYKRTKITLEVEGWMTAEEVADHYRHAQRQVLGKIPRSLDNKSRVLLDFVNQNKGMTWNKDTTWQQLYEKWNKEHPVWSFKQVGHFYQLHKNTFRKLVNGD